MSSIPTIHLEHDVFSHGRGVENVDGGLDEAAQLDVAAVERHQPALHFLKREQIVQDVHGGGDGQENVVQDVQVLGVFGAAGFGQFRPQQLRPAARGVERRPQLVTDVTVVGGRVGVEVPGNVT